MMTDIELSRFIKMLPGFVGGSIDFKDELTGREYKVCIREIKYKVIEDKKSLVIEAYWIGILSNGCYWLDQAHSDDSFIVTLCEESVEDCGRRRFRIRGAKGPVVLEAPPCRGVIMDFQKICGI